MIVMWDAGTIEVTRMWAERAGEKNGLECRDVNFWDYVLVSRTGLITARRAGHLVPHRGHHSRPISGQYQGHVITLDQSAASIQVMWSLSTNQSPGLGQPRVATINPCRPPGRPPASRDPDSCRAFNLLSVEKLCSLPLIRLPKTPLSFIQSVHNITFMN